MAEQRTKRRLAAIVAADVVGFSRQMELDEEGTLARINLLRSEFLEPSVLKNGGRIVKTTGDGALIEFASAVDAVAHAIDVQRGLLAHNADMSDGELIEIRMGINVGDVIIENEDIFGSGVNIAARLEAMAKPGGICISSRVYDLIAGRFDIGFDDLGAQKLKNIVNPVVVYNVVLNSDQNSSQATLVAENLPLPDKPSIAVIPFDNLSGDPEQEYFSDGMTDDIITDLSKIPELFVIARNSSFVFKGQMVDAKEIGRRLGVRYLLEGSVRRAASKLRINAQLIDTLTDGHIWADRYDGSIEDIFSLQDEMTEKIVSALELAIAIPQMRNSKSAPAPSVESYDLLLKARRLFYQFTPESLEQSKRMLDSVLLLNTESAEAYSLLSYCQFVYWNIHMADEATLTEAFDLANKAVELDPGSGNALARKGWVLCFFKRFDEAIDVFQQAIIVSPSTAEVYAYYGETLNYADRPEEGLKMIEQGMRLDPLGPPNWDFHRGHSLYKMQRHTEAIEAIKQSINRSPSFPVSYLYLAVLYIEQNQLELAIKTAQSAVKYNPLYTIRSVSNVIAHRPDEMERFLTGLRKAGLPE